VLVVADTVKPTSAEAVRRLRGMGLRPVLLTGDNERAARAVAAVVGIDEVIAGVRPAGKVDAIRRLQDAGRGLGVRLQHRGHPARGARIRKPADRRRRDGVQLGVRGHQ